MNKSYRYNEDVNIEETKDPSFNSTKMDYYYFKHLVKLYIRAMIKKRKDISVLRAYVKANMTDW